MNDGKLWKARMQTSVQLLAKTVKPIAQDLWGNWNPVADEKKSLWNEEKVKALIVRLG